MTELVVKKLPRDFELVDRPIAFPPLKRNLHLEFLEVKKKLKPAGSLPPLKIYKKRKPFVAHEENTKPAAPQGQDKKSSRSGSQQTTIAIPTFSSRVPEEKVPVPRSEAKTTPREKKESDPVVSDLAEDDASEDSEASNGNDAASEESEGSEQSETLGDREMLGELGEEGAVPESKPVETTAVDMDPDEEADDEEAEADEADPDDLLSPEEREARDKEEYIWRFHILRKSHKGKKFPTFTEMDDLSTMKMTYQRTLKEISLDQSVNSYRDYLIGGFLIIENLGKHFIDPCFDGYATHQMQMMDKYDTLLVELGEKSYNRWGVKLPVELRLLGMIIIQAGMFYMMSRSGNSESGLASIIKVASGAGRTKGTVTEIDPETEEEEDDDKPSKPRKMRGPSMSPDDIRKMGGG